MWKRFKEALRLAKPSPEAAAAEELNEAELALLTAQSGLEWARANVTYNTERVCRLRMVLNRGGFPVKEAQQ